MLVSSVIFSPNRLVYRLSLVFIPFRSPPAIIVHCVVSITAFIHLRSSLASVHSFQAAIVHLLPLFRWLSSSAPVVACSLQAQGAYCTSLVCLFFTCFGPINSCALYVCWPLMPSPASCTFLAKVALVSPVVWPHSSSVSLSYCCERSDKVCSIQYWKLARYH